MHHALDVLPENTHLGGTESAGISAERERTNLFDAKCFDTLDGWSRLLNNCSRHTLSKTS